LREWFAWQPASIVERGKQQTVRAVDVDADLPARLGRDLRSGRVVSQILSPILAAIGRRRLLALLEAGAAATAPARRPAKVPREGLHPIRNWAIKMGR
jgi:hypothetical protein